MFFEGQDQPTSSDLDIIDDLLQTARDLKLSTEYCARCQLVTSYMYETKTCGHLYCSICLKKIKKCVKCNLAINRKDLFYRDIKKQALKRINTIQKEIDKLRSTIRTEQNNKTFIDRSPNSNTSLATVSKTFQAPFVEDELLFDHEICDCMNFCGLHFRSLSIKNEKKWINRKVSRGETYLFMACKNGKAEVSETLISLGANINIQNDRGWTPLHKAVVSGNLILVENLLKRGAFINVPNENYDTPLHKAIEANHFKMAQLLVKYGACIRSRNYEGRTPWQVATQKMRNKLLPVDIGQIILATPIFRKQFKFFIVGSLAFRTSYPMTYLMKYINITFVDEINEDVTHVIYQGRSKIMPLTYQFLLAIMYRVPVVTKEWIEVCATFKQLHSYSEYLIIGTQDYKYDAVNRAVINSIKMEPRLFSGYNFYIPEPEEGKHFIFGSRVMSREELTVLLIAGGAKILQEKPKNLQKQKPKFPWHAPAVTTITNCCHYVVVANDVNILESDNCRLKYVPHSWIYECILRYRIMPPSTTS